MTVPWTTAWQEPGGTTARLLRTNYPRGRRRVVGFSPVFTCHLVNAKDRGGIR